jgi:hypothetical protein
VSDSNFYNRSKAGEAADFVDIDRSSHATPYIHDLHDKNGWGDKRRASDQLLPGGHPQPRPILCHYESVLHSIFAPAIEDALRTVGGIYEQAGLSQKGIEHLKGRELGVAVAEAMFNLAKTIGFPTKLSEVSGFSQDHIERALAAAKNPQPKMKLQNMPVPLTAEMIDEYMGPILESARDGGLSRIKNVT